MTRELTTLQSTEVLSMRLAALSIGWSRFIVLKLHAYVIVACNSTYCNLTGSVPMIGGQLSIASTDPSVWKFLTAQLQ